jgi:hypothetical protein
MYVVVISLMFGAVIVMVKKTDKEMISRISDSSIRVRPNSDRRTGRVTEGHFTRLKLIKR